MAAVLGFAFMTSSAVGAEGAPPKEEWGLPAAPHLTQINTNRKLCLPTYIGQAQTQVATKVHMQTCLPQAEFSAGLCALD